MDLENREDAPTWRDRLIGKRLVTSSRHVALHDGWKSRDKTTWEPRIYFSAPLGEGKEKDMQWNVQKGSPLLMLPAEIRRLILEEVLPPQMLEMVTKVGWKYGDAKWMNTSAVVFCCRQLFVEGRGLAVASHTFAWESLPKKTRLCSAKREKQEYEWDR